jgi:hypothetical protein
MSKRSTKKYNWLQREAHHNQDLLRNVPVWQGTSSAQHTDHHVHRDKQAGCRQHLAHVVSLTELQRPPSQMGKPLCFAPGSPGLIPGVGCAHFAHYRMLLPDASLGTLQTTGWPTITCYLSRAVSSSSTCRHELLPGILDFLMCRSPWTRSYRNSLSAIMGPQNLRSQP